MRKLVYLFLILTTLSTFASISTKVYLNYKNAKELYRLKRYKKAMAKIQNILKAYPKYYRAKKLRNELYKKGVDAYEDALALKSFDKELSYKYTNLALNLLPKKSAKAKKLRVLKKELEQSLNNEKIL